MTAPISVLELVRLSEVKPEPINWLWPGRIAKGKITFIAGLPGLGKSQVTVSIAAIVSSGGIWPVDEMPADVGNVLILSTEDGIADTIKPRLLAAGADTNRIEAIEAVREGDQRFPFSLERDLELLRDTEASLLIVDPLAAYMGGVDSHKDADVRAFLAPLSDFAQRTEMAVVCVSHLNKSSGKEAILRMGGSIGFVATARAVHIVTTDSTDRSRRLFVSMKNNLALDQGGLAFRIESKEPEPGIMTSAVDWESEAISISADEALESLNPEERGALDDAKEFLEELLADSSMPGTTVREAATKAGHAWVTVRRAKGALGITSEKQGMQGPWVWQLPTKMLTDPEDTHPSEVIAFGENEHLREPDDDLQQTITDLLSRHPRGLSNEDVAVILKVPLIKVEAVRGDHG